MGGVYCVYSLEPQFLYEQRFTSGRILNLRFYASKKVFIELMTWVAKYTRLPGGAAVAHSWDIVRPGECSNWRPPPHSLLLKAKVNFSYWII